MIQITPGRSRGLKVKIRQPTLTGSLVNRLIVVALVLRNVLHHLLDMKERGLIFHAHLVDQLFVIEIFRRNIY